MKTDSIVVIGGGSAGWMTATTLKKTFPEKNISVVESKDVPIVGVGESTIGGIRKWAQWIGLKEESFFPQTDASIKMSIKFTDFYKKDAGSFQYPFGTAVQEGERNPFSDWAMKKHFYPNTPVEDLVRCLFPAAALFESNKYSENLEYEFDNFSPENDIAYHFDATKFGIWLRDEFCIPNGVTHIVGTVASITQDDEGITGLVLEDGTTVTADLYVDCTGFKSLLLGNTLEQPFESYEHLLPNNRAWATRIEYKDKEKELEGFTNCTAIENGWCWNIPLWSRLGAGYVYSDKFVTPEQAQKEFKNYLMSDKMVIPRTQEEVDALTFKDVQMRVGIHTETFVKNVVAIGLSAGFIEPLESSGLFSVHEFLFKLTDILRRNDVSQFDRDMYNNSVRQIFDEFTKFVAMHYGLSHRDDTDYWKAVQKRKLSDRFGDPYTPYLGRQDGFAQMGRRYMELWYHPFDKSGIPFISTGMHLDMLNEYRFLNIQKANPLVNYSQETNDVYSRWEDRKRRWAASAEKAPTLTQYLYDRFYKETKND